MLVHALMLTILSSHPTRSALFELPQDRATEQSVEKQNAKDALQIFDDATLARIEAELVSSKVSAEAARAIVDRYRKARDSAIEDIILLWRRDPGERIYEEDIKRSRERFPQGQPAGTEEKSDEEHSRDISEKAERATAESGIREEFRQLGKKYHASVLALADGARDAVHATGPDAEGSARRLRWHLLDTWWTQPVPRRLIRAFEVDVDVVALLRRNEKTSGWMTVDEFGLVRGGDESILPSIDNLLEKAAQPALIKLQANSRDRVERDLARLTKAIGERLAADDQVMSIAAKKLQSEGHEEAGKALEAAYLELLAPSVFRKTWLERDAGVCVDTLHEQKQLSDDNAGAMAADLGRTLQELDRLRARVVEAGLLWRRNLSSPSQSADRARLLAAMQEFDEFNAKAKKRFVGGLPEGWDVGLARARGHSTDESMMDELTKRRRAVNNTK